MTAGPIPESLATDSRLRALLVDRDYQEVVTYSFVDPKIQALIDPQVSALALANPISADLAVMRTTLWPGLLQAILHNQNRQRTRVRLFEIGRTFLAQGQELVQERMLGGAVTGDALGEQWGVPSRGVDFYDVKADIEALCTLAGFADEVRFTSTFHPALHPGQAAEIRHHGELVGRAGLLHPELQSRLGLDRPIILFELALSELQREKIPVFREFSKFPSIRRDVAIIVPEATPAQVVLECVEKATGNLLVNLELFDEYRGKGIDYGRKSLALGLTLQDSSRTLNEDEIERVMAEVIAALGSKLGATVRH